MNDLSHSNEKDDEAGEFKDEKGRKMERLQKMKSEEKAKYCKIRKKIMLKTKDTKRKGPSECQKQNKMKIKMEKKISYVKKSQENVAYNCELEMVITVEKTTLK